MQTALTIQHFILRMYPHSDHFRYRSTWANKYQMHCIDQDVPNNIKVGQFSKNGHWASYAVGALSAML